MNKIANEIYYIGVNDHEIDLFEGQYDVPNGMAYNSYIILDEKIAVFDTVDGNFTDQWLENISNTLEGRKPDYLIVQHMEPDHSANILNFIKAYPEAVIVGNAKTFAMMSAYFEDIDSLIADKKLEVKDGDTLSLGRHELTSFLHLWYTGRRSCSLTTALKKFFSRLTHSENSALSTLTKTGLARLAATISES